VNMNNENKYEKLELAIAKGLIGGALGALFINKTESTVVAALVGAALGATYQAFKESQNLDSGVLYEENGYIYRALPDGNRVRVKPLVKKNTEIPKTFTIG